MYFKIISRKDLYQSICKNSVKLQFTQKKKTNHQQISFNCSFFLSICSKLLWKTNFKQHLWINTKIILLTTTSQDLYRMTLIYTSLLLTNTTTLMLSMQIFQQKFVTGFLLNCNGILIDLYQSICKKSVKLQLTQTKINHQQISFSRSFFLSIF